MGRSVENRPQTASPSLEIMRIIDGLKGQIKMRKLEFVDQQRRKNVHDRDILEKLKKQLNLK